MHASAAETYDILRLHYRSDDSWAVISAKTGAILIVGERLAMRMTRERATALAAQATRDSALEAAHAVEIAARSRARPRYAAVGGAAAVYERA